MVAGGCSSVGGRWTWLQRGTQQGGTQVGTLSTRFEIQTQGIVIPVFHPGFQLFFFNLIAVGQARLTN